MPEAVPSSETDAERKRERIRQYLLEHLDREGEFYCKSKFLASDLEYSAKEIGTAMPDLAESATAFTVEKWSYTNATTWRIAPDRSAGR